MWNGEQRGKTLVVPVEGIEPPLLAERDFESRASTSSATRASAGDYTTAPVTSKRNLGAVDGLAPGGQIGTLLPQIAG
jgi:hypothetical protein